MSVEHNIGNCDKLYADTCFYENIFMRTHPCKSKSCVEERLFHSEHASQSFAWVKPLFSDMTLYVKNCILRRVRKLSHAVVHRFDLSTENLVTNLVSYV